MLFAVGHSSNPGGQLLSFDPKLCVGETLCFLLSFFPFTSRKQIVLFKHLVCLICNWTDTTFANWTVAVLMQIEGHFTQAKDLIFYMLLLSNFYLTGVDDLLACLLVSVKYYILFQLLRGRMGESGWQSLPEDGLAVWSHLELSECGGRERQKRSQEDSRGNAVVWCPVKHLERHWTWERIVHRPGIQSPDIAGYCIT